MNLSVRKIVISGILGAIAILLGVTRLGFIPVPTPAGHATIMHIPVILGGVLEGPAVGLITGAIFGLFSFLQPGAPFFADPLVSIFPRLFIGVISYLVYAVTFKIGTGLGLTFTGSSAISSGGIKSEASPAATGGLYKFFNYLPLILAGAAGSATNTVLVMGMATLRGYLPPEVSISVGVLHGIPELILAAILTVILVTGIRRIRPAENND